LNISLTFPPPQRSILPLRLSIIQVSNLRPPVIDDEDDIELHINQSTTIPSPLGLLVSNKTTEYQRLIDDTPTKSYVHKETSIGNIWMLILGLCAGLILAGLSFTIYYIIWNKNRPKFKKQLPPTDSNSSSIKRSTQGHKPLLKDNRTNEKYKPMISLSSNQSNEYVTESITETSSELTTTTTSSSSYRPDIIL
jgi:hypothetical protein